MNDKHNCGVGLLPPHLSIRRTMSLTKPPPAWLSLLLYLGLFFGGGGLGIWVARWVAPDSNLAEFVSFLVLPAGFMFGIFGWAGAAIPAAIRRLLRRRAAQPIEKSDSKPIIVPGSFAFVPAALVTCVPAGMLVGVLSPDLGFVRVLLLYAGLGLGFGIVCWLLARAGYLQFPRE
jgi:hypothetical protein